MEKRNYIKEAYDNCLKEAVLLVRNSGNGGVNFSESVMIITKDNELYNYHTTSTYTKDNKMMNTVSLSKTVEFNEEQMNKIIDFVREHVLSKNGTFNKMFDASYSISGTVDGKHFSVVNDFELTVKLKKVIDNIADEIIKENIIV